MRIIAGRFKGHPLLAPKGTETRPTASRLRETLFNILQQEIEGADFLDIFAGSGAIGLEALSRGASHCTFIDSSKAALKTLDSNLEKLKSANQASLLYGDYIKMLATLQKKSASFNCIFADAPYAMHEVTATLLDLIPKYSLLKPSGVLFIENTEAKAPLEIHESLTWINSRRSGMAYLHQYRLNQ